MNQQYGKHQHRAPYARAAQRADEGFAMGTGQQFWAAVATSAPQPVGALLAYALVEQIIELAAEAFRRGARGRALAGTLFGAALMLVLAALLGV